MNKTETSARFVQSSPVQTFDQATLTPEQSRVQVLPENSLHSVVGAPGTGKTTALIARYQFLVTQLEIAPSEIQVFSASRSAAARLRDQLALAVSVSLQSAAAKTTGGLAFAIVRRHALASGQPLPELISGAEQALIIRQLIDSANYPWKADRTTRSLRGFATEVRNFITVCLEHQITPERLESLANQHNFEDWAALAELLADYQGLLGSEPFNNRFDSIGLLDRASQLLRSREVAEHPKVILIDDAQELSPSAIRFLSNLADERTGLTCFADPDAAVMSFRTGEVSGYQKLLNEISARQKRDPEKISFQNDSSSTSAAAGPTSLRPSPFGSQLGAISARIGVSAEGQQRRANTAGQSSAAPIAFIAGSSSIEISWLAHQLRRLHLIDQIPWNEMAVVARSAETLLKIESALAAKSVPVLPLALQVPLKDEFGSAALLRLADFVVRQTPVDEQNISELLLSPVSSLDHLALRRLRRALRVRYRESSDSLSGAQLLAEAFEDQAMLADIKIQPARRFERFANTVKAARQLAQNPASNIEELLWLIWSQSGLEKQWPNLATAADTEVSLQANRNLDSVVALFAAAHRFVERNPNSSNAEFLSRQLEQDVPEDFITRGGSNPIGISLLTPSALISNRFKVVAIPQLQEGVWPNLKARNSLLRASSLEQLAIQQSAPEPRAEIKDELRMLYKTVGASSETLLISAVETEELQISQFFRLLVRELPEVTNTSPPELTLRSLVGSTRRRLSTEQNPIQRQRQASLLVRLAAHGIPGAHPSQWYGLAAMTSGAPVQAEQVVVRPSQLEKFLTCPLHWFIETHGGQDSNYSVRVGTLIHEILELGLEPDLESYLGQLQSRWNSLEFESQWLSKRELRRANLALVRLVDYLTKFRAESGRVIGVEVPFEASHNGVAIRGKADRLELYPDGRVVIVDLKTSTKAISSANAAENPQLGLYQLAFQLGGFDASLPHQEANRETSLSLGGAKLLQIGFTESNSAVAKESAQNSLDDNPALLTFLETALTEASQHMHPTTQIFTARVGKHCSDDHQFGSCGLHLVKAVSYGG